MTAARSIQLMRICGADLVDVRPSACDLVGQPVLHNFRAHPAHSAEYIGWSEADIHASAPSSMLKWNRVESKFATTAHSMGTMSRNAKSRSTLFSMSKACTNHCGWGCHSVEP